MSAGLPTDDPWGDRQQDLDLDAFAAPRGPGRPSPGPRDAGSSTPTSATAILGRVITRVAGREYQDVVRERVLEPLGHDRDHVRAAAVPADRLAHGYLWRDDTFVEEPIDPVRRARLDGRPVHDHPRSRHAGSAGSPTPSRRATTRTHRRCAARRAARCSRSTGDPRRYPGGGAGRADGAETGGYGFGLFIDRRLRAGRIVGPLRRLSRLRLEHALAARVRSRCHRARQRPLWAGHGPCPRALRPLDGPRVRRDPERPSRLAGGRRPRVAVERLLAAWDDDLAAQLFAMNVDLDEDLAPRRAAIDRLRTSTAP